MSEEVNVKGDYSDQRSPGESVRRADGEEVTVSASVLLRAALSCTIRVISNKPVFVRCHTRVAAKELSQRQSTVAT